MAVATDSEPAEVKTVGAGIHGFGGYDAFLQEGEPLAGLEGGAGGIGTHDGAVEQGLARVVLHFYLVPAALAADHDAGVVGGTGDHAEYLARGGLNGDNGAELAGHQALAELLQLDVDA